MTALFQQLILDAQQQEYFTGTPRRIHIEMLPGKATVLIGVRRCGKSTFLNQVLARLLSDGVDPKNILYINFFDDRLKGMNPTGLDKLLEAYFLLYPAKKGNEKIFCFFDEIQTVPDWEPFIDRILRTENCEVYLSGSSADLLSREIATQMRGRALSWELFPFSFAEFLDHQKISPDLPFSTAHKLELRNAFESYWEQGGFPEVFDQTRLLRIKLHQEYLASILFRDLIERHDIPHPRALVDLAHRLINQAGSLYTLNGLTNFLKSLGHKVPKMSVSDYLMWFEDAYFLFTVRMFDASWHKSNANPKKIYCIDHSLIRSVSTGILVNSGHWLENLVFVALRRKYSEIYYYRTRNNQEVDFLCIGMTGEKELYQVSESLVNPAIRKREIQALHTAMEETGLQSGTLITRTDEEKIIVDRKTIEVVPVWKFLLEFR